MAYPATPRAVIINEAIEIAHKFSSPESVHFINGVLDSIGKELEKGTAARHETAVKSMEPGGVGALRPLLSAMGPPDPQPCSRPGVRDFPGRAFSG